MRYLLKLSGAKDIEELKAALIDPASYTQPFRMNGSFVWMDALFCRIESPRTERSLAWNMQGSTNKEVAPPIRPSASADRRSSLRTFIQIATVICGLQLTIIF